MKKLLLALFVAFTILTPNVLAQDTNLPSSYDARQKGWVTPVKNQALWGTCWSFGSLSSVETNLIKKGAKTTPDLSERALAWYTSRLQKTAGASSLQQEGMYALNLDDYGLANNIDPEAFAALNNGGNPAMAANQLVTWNGALTEQAAPYVDDEHEYIQFGENQYPSMSGTWSLPYSMIYDNAFHVQNTKLYMRQFDPEVFDTVMKENLLTYGAAQINYHADNIALNPETGAYYISDAMLAQNPSLAAANHAVSIVGWDDNYPASNFLEDNQPPADGAWIVKNSWGPEWADGGFFYISYYDPSFNTASFFDAENKETGYSYDDIYQYDYLGDKGFYMFSHLATVLVQEPNLNPGDLKAANVFTAKSNETLKAVSGYNYLPFEAQYTSTVYLLNDNYKNPEDGKKVATVVGTSETIGFTTFELDTPVELKAGQKFSVVQEILYDIDGELKPLISLEYGLEDVMLNVLQSSTGAVIGTSVVDALARVNAGESYVYGVSGGLGTPGWADVAAVSEESNPLLSSRITYSGWGTGVSQDNISYAGNAMIKAYTSGGTAPVPGPELDDINLVPDNDVLATAPGAVNTTTIRAELTPANASAEELKWMVIPDNIVSLKQTSPTTAEVTAINEGEAVILCYNGSALLTGTAKGSYVMQVTNNQVIMDDIIVDYPNLDSFTVTAENVRANSAIGLSNDNIDSLSLFCWSEENQADMNAKLMHRIDGTNDWAYENVPINDTPVNNYFIDADNIQIHVYGSYAGNLNYLRAMSINWVSNYYTAPAGFNHTVAYIAYANNIGFVKPTVYDFTPAGITDNEAALAAGATNLEGLRVSSCLPGALVATRVYVSGIGWMDPVNDGVYAGTMWQNRPIEAVSLKLYGASADQHSIFYRVYIEGQGWTDLTSNGNYVGTPGSGNKIQDIRVIIQ